MKTKTTTKQRILAALKSGKWVNIWKLTMLCESTKVATRISELRRDGYYIQNEITHKNGSIVSKYRLVA